MAATLSSFGIKCDQKHFMLRIKDDEGEIIELIATYEQLELISEALEEHLAFGVEELDPDEEDEESEGL
jgi:Mg/Co/Ni transporter MgtE